LCLRSVAAVAHRDNALDVRDGNALTLCSRSATFLTQS